MPSAVSRPRGWTIRPSSPTRFSSSGASGARDHYFGVGLGSDTGGFSELPGPPSDAAQNPLQYPFHSYMGNVEFAREQTGERTFDLNTDGVAHYGLVPDLLADTQTGAARRQGDATAVPLRPGVLGHVGRRLPARLSGERTLLIWPYGSAATDRGRR